MRPLAAAAAGTGVWLLLTALLDGRRDLLAHATVQRWRARHPRKLRSHAPALIAGCAGALLALLVFGGVLPALALGAFAATAPSGAARRARTRRLEMARSHWPQLIEELRVLTGSLGHSIPSALFNVGKRAPLELRSAFERAEREWLLTTDLQRALSVLKDELADPTADTICETLLIAHEVGGGGLDQRLAALADDRDRDLQHRRDGEARQAGARFARRFVLLVPTGMAVAGMSVGTGRSAYERPTSQLLVLAALAMIVACWVWAGRIMQLPATPRVLNR